MVKKICKKAPSVLPHVTKAKWKSFLGTYIVGVMFMDSVLWSLMFLVVKTGNQCKEHTAFSPGGPCELVVPWTCVSDNDLIVYGLYVNFDIVINICFESPFKTNFTGNLCNYHLAFGLYAWIQRYMEVMNFCVLGKVLLSSLMIKSGRVPSYLVGLLLFSLYWLAVEFV